MIKQKIILTNFGVFLKCMYKKIKEAIKTIFNITKNSKCFTDI